MAAKAFGSEAQPNVLGELGLPSVSDCQEVIDRLDVLDLIVGLSTEEEQYLRIMWGIEERWM